GGRGRGGARVAGGRAGRCPPRPRPRLAPRRVRAAGLVPAPGRRPPRHPAQPRTERDRGRRTHHPRLGCAGVRRLDARGGRRRRRPRRRRLCVRQPPPPPPPPPPLPTLPPPRPP